MKPGDELVVRFRAYKGVTPKLACVQRPSWLDRDTTGRYTRKSINGRARGVSARRGTAESGNAEGPLRKVFLQRLGSFRRRLLDLSNRNRLVSFKHSDRARTHIRVIDELPDVLFATLRDGKRMRFKPLPEPETEPQDETTEAFLMALEAARATDEQYKIEIEALGDEEGSSRKASAIERALRDRVREKLGMEPWIDQSALSKEEFARLHGIEPSFELPRPLGDRADSERHFDDEIQTLHFPREMDRKLSGIVDQARTMAQEAGVSTLRAAFGFLEWREADRSETHHLSPLVLLPVTIVRKKGQPWRHYEVYGDGSELETNRTLAIRLSKGFGYDLPEFEDEDTAETYLARIEQSVQGRPKWRVRRFVTIGNFGFSKLAMHTDIDPALWLSVGALADDGLVWQVVMGKDGPDGDSFDLPDYEIDSKSIDAKNLSLAADADASQYSAIIDVAGGKNLVVEGPPGTGKSQTITNIISASLARGKTVLFMSEKMAALDIVLSRLDSFGLGAYCLEVHSNKASKRAILDSLAKRLELQDEIESPAIYESKLEELRATRNRLNEYAAALEQKVGDLGLTVQQILWAERRARDEAGDSWQAVRDQPVAGALDLTLAQRGAAHTAIEAVLGRVPDLARVCGSLTAHPWAWVANHEITIPDEDQVEAAVERWRQTLGGIIASAQEFRQRFGPLWRNDLETLARIAKGADQLPMPSQPIVAVMARAMADQSSRNAVAALLRTALFAVEGTGRSEGVVLRELPSISEDWDEWTDRVREAVSRIGELAPAAACLDAATTTRSTADRDRTKLTQFEGLARAVQTSVGAGGEITVDFAEMALRAGRLAAEVSTAVLARRQPSLFEEGVNLVLSEAIERARKLRGENERLAKLFVLAPLPSLEQVDRCARVLRKAGSLGWLHREVRKAKTFFRSIAAAGAGAKGPEMTDRLTRLAGYLTARENLARDDRLARVCGRWFQGADTAFEALAEVHAWGRRVQAAFPANEACAGRLRNLLLEGRREDLERMARLVKEIDRDGDDSWLDRVRDRHGSLPALIAETARKTSDLGSAIDTLSEAGVNGGAPLTAVLKTVTTIGDLGRLRGTLLQAFPQFGDRRISLSLVIEARELDDELLSLGLPDQTLVRILSGDPSANLSWLQGWRGQVRTALVQEHEERSRVDDLVGIVEETLGGAEWPAAAELDAVIGRLDEALAHRAALASWLQFLRAKWRATELGLGELVSTLVEAEASPEQGVAAYDALVYRALTEAAFRRFPRLNEFDGIGLDQLRDRFGKLDREIIDLQREKLRSDLCHASIPAGTGVGLKRDFTELALIRSELAKRKRHIPLRNLFARAATAIHCMKPCMMMSPLSVATYLEPGAMSFDLVVIDEASQMPPEDAIGALLRARQCVIVGDRQQLPPTSFFRRFEDASEIEDEEGDDLDVESILDQASNVFLPPRLLRWHYRSRHQSLIAFSNKFFYDNRLTVFPSPVEKSDDMGVRLIQVNGQYAGRHNPAEARAVVEWARDFMGRRPDRSLGIVAINQLQRDLINDQMERHFDTDAEASRYREAWEQRDDGLFQFFVKNLENVQGDERDVIAISTVYGPNAEGKVMQNFGPISQGNGHRRLNVLFTRAREQVVLFSSLKPERIEIRENTGRGPRILRAYLDYAATGRLDPGTGTGRQPDSDFEVFVANRLKGLGYEVVPQVGVAGFFIDLGIRHPEFPGTFLTGVECDGATYHSAKSARDRDRLREEVLVGLGWTLYRIWSTDWFRDPDGETEKLRRFIERRAAERRSMLAASPTRAAIAEKKALDERDRATGVECEVAGRRPSEPRLSFEPAGSFFPPLDAIETDDGDARAASTMARAGERPSEHTVEIDDTVTFHFIDDPDKVKTLTIVSGEADVRVGTISARSPVGEALLGASSGEDVEVYGPQGSRTVIVDRIAKAKAPSALHESDEGERPLLDKRPSDGCSFRPATADDGIQARAPSKGTDSAGARIPFTAWKAKPLPDPREAGTTEVARHLREIIEVEGPIRVKRAYRLYAQACGIDRVGRIVRSEFNKALNHLVGKGVIALENEGPDDAQIHAIARVTGAPRVVVRTTGGRDFWEVPPSELAAVMEIEASRPFADEDELYHRVLARYGVRRLTSKISTELARIRKWSADAAS